MFVRPGEEKTEMNSNYMFLCGVMLCKFGQKKQARSC